MGGVCSCHAVVSDAPKRAALPRPDARSMIDAVTAARRAGVPLSVVHAHIQQLPTQSGAEVKTEWSAWAESLRASPLQTAPSLRPGAVAASEALWLPPKFASLRPTGSAAPGGCRIPETAARAISIPQLMRVLKLAERLCVDDSWKDHTGEPVVAARLNLYHLVKHLVMPATAEAHCSLVELFADGAQPPDAFVSHWWGESVRDFVACLEQFCADMQLDKETTHFWVCAYALNQHDLPGELPAGGLTSGPFVRALLLSNCALSVIDADGEYFHRAWCVYELYKSIVDCLDGFLHHIVTTAPDLQDREGRPVPAVCLIDGFAKTDDGDSEYKAHREKAFPQALLDKSQAFSLDKAQASEPADLRSIIEDVGDHKRSLEATMRVRFSIQMLQLGPSSMQDDKYALILLDLRDSQLRNLSLTYNLSLTWDRTQTESRALQLCEALPQSLVDLRIEDGHAALAIGMAESRPLRYGRMLTLKLESCAVDDAQLRILASAFAQSHTLQLRMLNFGNNRLSDEGAEALAAALPHVPQLQKLILRYNNNLSAEGVKALAAALHHVPQLQVLNLRRTDPGAGGSKALAAALCNVPQLQMLDLSETNIGEEDKELLHAAWMAGKRKSEGLLGLSLAAQSSTREQWLMPQA